MALRRRTSARPSSTSRACGGGQEHHGCKRASVSKPLAREVFVASCIGGGRVCRVFYMSLSLTHSRFVSFPRHGRRRYPCEPVPRRGATGQYLTLSTTLVCLPGGRTLAPLRKKLSRVEGCQPRLVPAATRSRGVKGASPGRRRAKIVHCCGETGLLRRVSRATPRSTPSPRALEQCT